MSQHAHHASLELGSIRIDRVIEQCGPVFERKAFFPTLSDEIYAAHRTWLEPTYFEPGTERVILMMQSWIIRTGKRTILVDTCCGNDKARPNRPMWHMLKHDTYMRNLKAAGLTPDDIDVVMCTHLHGDHVGWNTKLENGRWVPTFPKARYLMSAKELDFWTAKHAVTPEAMAWIGDSVLPVVEAGRVDRVTSDHALDDHIHLVATPGHTVDHFGVHVGTSGRDAFLTGDMVHSPIQCRHPELTMFADHDGRQAVATRKSIFSRFVDTPTLMCMAHFNAPSVGHLSRWEDGYRYTPLQK